MVGCASESCHTHTHTHTHTLSLSRHVPDARVDRHLVLPLELCPHDTIQHLGRGGRCDVVHDIDVDIIEHHAVLVRCTAASNVVHKVAKDDAGLGGRHLDIGLDPALSLWPNRVVLRSLAQLQVTQGCQFQADVLESIIGSIDDKYILNSTNTHTVVNRTNTTHMFACVKQSYWPLVGFCVARHYTYQVQYRSDVH
jgi:hypothetical protein